MVIAQDSRDPTGIVGSKKAGEAGNEMTRARNRKANAAINLKLAGATWGEIAEVLGFPTARAALVATERALEKELRSQGDRDAMRRLAGQRLERLLRGVWGKATDEDHPEQLIAATKAREIIGQHSKLFGLDAPAEVIIHSPTTREIEDWVLRVVSVQTPPVDEFDILGDGKDGVFQVEA